MFLTLHSWTGLHVAWLHRKRSTNCFALVLWVGVEICIKATNLPLSHATSTTSCALQEQETDDDLKITEFKQSVNDIFYFTYKPKLGDMPGNMPVTGRSAAGLNWSGSSQSSACMVREVFTSRSNADHLPCLQAFSTGHWALTMKASPNETLPCLLMPSYFRVIVLKSVWYCNYSKPSLC